jgi:hypothetical protein
LITPVSPANQRPRGSTEAWRVGCSPSCRRLCDSRGAGPRHSKATGRGRRHRVIACRRRKRSPRGGGPVPSGPGERRGCGLRAGACNDRAGSIFSKRPAALAFGCEAGAADAKRRTSAAGRMRKRRARRQQPGRRYWIHAIGEASLAGVPKQKQKSTSASSLLSRHSLRSTTSGLSACGRDR